MWQLRTGIPLPLGDVIDDTAGSHDGEKSDSSEHLKATMPCGQLWWGGGGGFYNHGRQLVDASNIQRTRNGVVAAFDAATT